MVSGKSCSIDIIDTVHHEVAKLQWRGSLLIKENTNLLEMIKGSRHQISFGHKLGHRLHINKSFPNLLLTMEEDCRFTFSRRLNCAANP